MDEFRLFLVRKGIKHNTIKGHIEAVKRVLAATPLDSIESYILSLIDRNCKSSYINNIIKALRIYGQFINNNKLRSLKYMKQEETIKATMSDKEIESFLLLPPPPGVFGVYIKLYNMNTLFWKCLAFTGARTGEIASLTVDSVDFGRNVFIVNGKTGMRYVPIPPLLIEPLQAYIKGLRGRYLFASMRTKKPIERATWNYDFKQRLKRLGIKRENLTPYSLRHSFITRMLDEDINLLKVQKIVGHKRVTTTAHYTHYTTKDIVATIHKDPLGRMGLSYEERLKQFRAIVRNTLESLALTVDEEIRMIEDLKMF